MKESLYKKYKNKLVLSFTKLINDFIEMFFPHLQLSGWFLPLKFGIHHNNWGDDINYYFLKAITHKHITKTDFTKRSKRIENTNYAVVGSIIADNFINHKTIIWGSGVLDPQVKLQTIPKKVLAVRGPLTRQYLLNHQIECPEIYGDPALLIAKYYTPKVQKKYKLGYILHYSEVENDVITHLEKDEQVLLIRLNNYTQWTDPLDRINECENIISSSLHGLIMAEAYGIPNLWVESSKRLDGHHFKFHDFLCSINRDRKHPYQLEKDEKMENLLNELKEWEPGFIDLKPLLNACPFLLKETINIS